jgi:hypothetical protein
MPVYELIAHIINKVLRNAEVQDVSTKNVRKIIMFRKEGITMKKIFTFTIIILCLSLFAGFGIANALDKKETGEKMMTVSEKQPLEEGAALEEAEKAVDEAEMEKEDADITGKQEVADESMKKMDAPEK